LYVALKFECVYNFKSHHQPTIDILNRLEGLCVVKENVKIQIGDCLCGESVCRGSEAFDTSAGPSPRAYDWPFRPTTEEKSRSLTPSIDSADCSDKSSTDEDNAELSDSQSNDGEADSVSGKMNTLIVDHSLHSYLDTNNAIY